MTLIPAAGSEGSPLRVAILLFGGAQLIDLAGPWEVFGTAGLLVHTVAEKPEMLTAVVWLSIYVHHTSNIQYYLNMNRPSSPQEPVRTLSAWNQVRAMADPLRMRIVDALREKPMTTKQVAILLGERPTKLYHHVELLEEAGLVLLIETRRKRGTMEKYYCASAAEFVVDRKLLERKSGPRRATTGYESLFLSALEASLREVEYSVAAKLIRPVSQGRNALAYRTHFQGSEFEMQALMRKVLGWIRQCQALRGGRGQQKYGIIIAFYPTRIRRNTPAGAEKQENNPRRREQP